MYKNFNWKLPSCFTLQLSRQFLSFSSINNSTSYINAYKFSYQALIIKNRLFLQCINLLNS